MNKRFAFMLVAYSLLAGCAGTPTMHSTFEDIASETQDSDTSLIKYHNLISLNGLMPLHVPGMLFLEPNTGESSPTSASSAPSLLIGISPKRSLIVDVRYRDADARKHVKTTQQKYLELRGAALKEIAAKIRVDLLRQLQNKGLSEENKTLILTALHLPKGTDVSKLDANIQAANGELNSAQLGLAKTLRGFSDSLQDNMVLLNWTETNKFHGLASYLKILQANADQNSERRGVLILGGLRVVNTLIGEDLYCMAQNAASNQGQSKRLKYISITTNLVQAQAVGYVSDLTQSSALSASLDVSADTLKKLSDAGALNAKDLQAYSASALVASAMAVSNIGRLSKPEVSQRPYRFFPATKEADDLGREIGEASGYITLSVTRAQLTDNLIAALQEGAEDVDCATERSFTLGETVREANRTVGMTISRAMRAAIALESLEAGKGNGALLKEIEDGLDETGARANGILAQWSEAIDGQDRRVSDSISRASKSAVMDDSDSAKYDLQIARLQRMRFGRRLLDWYDRASLRLSQTERNLLAAKEEDPADAARRLTEGVRTLAAQKHDGAPRPRGRQPWKNVRP